MKNKKEYGIYIHIPFCISKCKYCDYNSYSNCEKDTKAYIQKLISDINDSNYFTEENCICKSIYFGGGTPSYINEEYIVEILNCIRSKYIVEKDVEITIECNPSSINEKKLRAYLECGINRISIGLQSTNNNILRIIGRKHDYEMFLEKYNLTKKIGFSNINIDLMIGLPMQTINDVEMDLKRVVCLNPTHISSYSLILYNETKLFSEIQENKYILPTDDEERKMYYLIKDILENKGYAQYEISNYSKKGFESKHNILYWKQNEYIGFGAGAHSFIENKRMYNIENIYEFLNAKEMIVEEEMTEKDLMKEYMIIGLRLIKGVLKKDFYNKFREDIDIVFKNELDKLEKMKLINNNNISVSLSKKGLDFANIVWEEFI